MARRDQEELVRQLLWGTRPVPPSDLAEEAAARGERLARRRMLGRNLAVLTGLLIVVVLLVWALNTQPWQGDPMTDLPPGLGW